MGGAPKRIVVGYDASRDAEQAVEWAVSTARFSDQRVELVIAVSAMDLVLSDFPPGQRAHCREPTRLRRDRSGTPAASTAK